DYRIKSTATPGLTALNLTQVSLNEDGLVLTPAPVAGPDPTDGSITIVSSTGNTAPVAANDSFATNEDSAEAGTARGELANDTDIDSPVLTAVVVTGPSHGALTLNANGSFTYTPAANFNGADSFTYKANDGQADSNVATVALTISPVNDAPVAVNDSFATNEDTALTITAPGVLGNDTDVDSPALTAVDGKGPRHDSLTLKATYSVTYTQKANFNGPDSFTYK